MTHSSFYIRHLKTWQETNDQNKKDQKSVGTLLQYLCNWVLLSTIHSKKNETFHSYIRTALLLLSLFYAMWWCFCCAVNSSLTLVKLYANTSIFTNFTYEINIGEWTSQQYLLLLCSLNIWINQWSDINKQSPYKYICKATNQFHYSLIILFPLIDQFHSSI